MHERLNSDAMISIRIAKTMCGYGVSEVVGW